MMRLGGRPFGFLSGAWKWLRGVLPPAWFSESTLQKWRRTLVLSVAALAAVLGGLLIFIAVADKHLDNVHLIWLAAYPLATGWGILWRRSWSRTSARWFLMLIVAAPVTATLVMMYHSLFDDSLPKSASPDSFVGVAYAALAILGVMIWIIAGPFAWILWRKFRQDAYVPAFGAERTDALQARILDLILAMLFVSLGVFFQLLPQIRIERLREANQHAVVRFLAASQSNDVAELRDARAAVLRQNPLLEILAQLGDENAQVRRTVIELFDELNWQQTQPHTAQPFEQTPLYSLLALHLHEDLSVRREVMRVIGEFAFPMYDRLAIYLSAQPINGMSEHDVVKTAIFQALVDGARDSDSLTRAYAGRGLAGGGSPSLVKVYLGDERSVALLSDMLRHDVAAEKAAQALGEMGSSAAEAIPLLQQAAQHEQKHIADAAQEALKKVRDTKTPRASQSD